MSIDEVIQKIREHPDRPDAVVLRDPIAETDVIEAISEQIHLDLS